MAQKRIYTHNEVIDTLVGGKVKKAQISRIENGKNLTIATILKVFKALDVDAKLHISDHSLALS